MDSILQESMSEEITGSGNEEDLEYVPNLDVEQDIDADSIELLHNERTPIGATVTLSIPANKLRCSRPLDYSESL